MDEDYEELKQQLVVAQERADKADRDADAIDADLHIVIAQRNKLTELLTELTALARHKHLLTTRHDERLAAALSEKEPLSRKRATEKLVGRIPEFTPEERQRHISGKYVLDDYINAVNGIGPLAFTWIDKPHRLVYDLVNRLKGLDEGL